MVRTACCARLAVVTLVGLMAAVGADSRLAGALQRDSPGGFLRNGSAPFSISLVPTVPVPIRVGTQLGFRLSSSTAGYAGLYLLDPVGEVWVLAENLPFAAGSLVYPPSSGSFTLAASEPVGLNRVILLVTRQPFAGFSGNATLTRPVILALRASEFVPRLNLATSSLPPGSWATDEIQVRIVG